MQNRNVPLLVVQVMVVGLFGCMSFGTTPPPPRTFDSSKPTSYQASVDRCMQYGGASRPICEAQARQQFGSQDAAATAEQWLALEQRTRTLLDGAQPAPVQRLQSTTRSIAVPLIAEAGRCYRLALAWAPARATHVTLMFGETNMSLQGTNKTLNEPGTLEFCADKSGTVRLSINGLETSGAIMVNARLEYALAVASRVEPARETAARRTDERQRAKDARAQTEANLYSSEAGKHGDAFARSCSRCRRANDKCMDDTNDRESCRLSFETCAQAMGTNDRGHVLCGS